MIRSLMAFGIMIGLVFAQPPSDSLTPRIDPRVISDLESQASADFIVLMRQQANLVSAQRLAIPQQAPAAVSLLRQTQSTTQKEILNLLAESGAGFRSYWIANMIVVHGDSTLVEVLRARSDVFAIESDRTFRVIPEETSDRPRTGLSVEWNIQQIRAPELWASGVTGTGIVYANADTGVMWDHPALKSHYRGWNGTAVDHNYNWWDAIHEDLNDHGPNLCNPGGFETLPKSGTISPCDDEGHGTRTTGIGVGDDGEGNQIGVAPGAKWIGCRNMEENVGRPSTYIECLQFFVAPTDLNGNNPDPTKKADVVGNSYGCPASEGCSSESLHAAVENARAAGLFMAVSAGNTGAICGSISDPPAIEPLVTTIGATDHFDAIASFSSRGPVLEGSVSRREPDLVAPGVGIRSSALSGYSFGMGTSFASPHVAGSVLLLWSAFPALRGNVSQTEWLLGDSAVHLTSSQGCGDDLPSSIPNNVYGYGRVDALSAYNRWVAFSAAWKFYFPLIGR